VVLPEPAGVLARAVDEEATPAEEAADPGPTEPAPASDSAEKAATLAETLLARKKRKK